jgi:hypothetical protein
MRLSETNRADESVGLNRTHDQLWLFIGLRHAPLPDNPKVGTGYYTEYN